MGKYASLFTDEPEEENTLESVGQTKPVVYQVLLVDDEKNVLSALRRVFRQENYKILVAENGDEALKILEKETCQLMISDYMMPKMNGAELLRKAKKLYPDMIRIMLTGHADMTAVMVAVKEGAVYKFILKPWNDDDLRVTVGLALEQFDLIQKNKVLQEKNDENSKELNSLAKMVVTNRSQLAIMLHKRNLLNDQQLQELYKQQQIKKLPVLNLILESGWVTEKQVRDILRKDLMIEEVLLDEIQVDASVAALIPSSICRQQLVLPLKHGKRRLTLVMADPMDMGLIDDLKFTTGLEIQAVMAGVSEIESKILEVYGELNASLDDLDSLADLADMDDPFEGIEVLIEDEDDVSIEELLLGTDEPPAIRLVNAIIIEAIRLRASDIHIHPQTKGIVVRYRIDGVLHNKIQIPHSMHMPLVSRIKVMAELDITERRRPQDGRITVKTPLRIVDLRISSLPTINGEKIVMRILDRNSSVQMLEDLGMSKNNLKKAVSISDKPQGIILATGPTGSGKTTTLYSMLQHNATPEKNYVTIEDPVEYYLDMASQIMVKEKIGLDFSTVLRSILRQDPDVILLGEIRDFETAEVAFHAALTGHLVYSTLHTNSAVATIARLFDLGLKPYVVASALEAIIAQRLVRKICDNCSETVTADQNVLHSLGPVFQSSEIKASKGSGCYKCNNTGYSGRVAIYEVLVPSERIRHLIASEASIHEVTEQVAEEGITTLLNDALDKVNQGETTVEEIFRVLGPQVII
jgi:type II secretory ATPase GspE/PulE/Tfp pilus assembly ATPase PilB-like protein/DNA-binding response OmpR family regulator